MKMFRREVVRREGFSLRPAALFAAASATIPSTSVAVVPGASVAITPSPSPLPLPPFFRFVCHAPLFLPPPTPVLLSLFSVWLGWVWLGRREYNVCSGQHRNLYNLINLIVPQVCSLAILTVIHTQSVNPLTVNHHQSRKAQKEAFYQFFSIWSIMIKMNL